MAMILPQNYGMNHLVKANANIVPSPFPFSPPFFNQSQSPEPFPTEHTFPEMCHLAPSNLPSQASANVKFGCSALVNAALQDMLAAREEATSTTSIPPPNGIFTLFGSPIFPSTPGFNFHPDGFQFLGNHNLLPPPSSYSNMQPDRGPSIPNLVAPLIHNLEALTSIYHFTEPIVSTSRIPEPFSTFPPLLMEPLASGPRFLEPSPSADRYPVSVISGTRFPGEPLVSSPRLAIGVPAGFHLQHQALPPGSHLLPALPTGSCMPDSEALASSSRSPEPEVLASSFRMPESEALASSSPVPDPDAVASSSRMPEPGPLPPSFPMPETEPEELPSDSPPLPIRGKRPRVDAAAERRRLRRDRNRASAARSRQRYKAYVSELEREVDFLTDANDQIRRKTAMMRLTAPETDCRKRWFSRAASPPF